MSATKYTYSIQNDFPNHAVNSTKLLREIVASAIVTACDRVDTSGDVCDVWFKDALSAGDETILDGIVAAHDGVPDPATVEPVEIVGFRDLTGHVLYQRGFLYEATAGETSNFDEKFTANMLVQGGGWWVDANAVVGDYICCQVVDVDGVLYPAGTVLATFVDHMYACANEHESIGPLDDAMLLPAGVYLRAKYVSVGQTNVKFRPYYILRRA